jgi:hypothetical protein
VGRLWVACCAKNGGGGRPEDAGDGLLVLGSAACSTGVRKGERGGENGHDSVRIRTVREHDGRGSSARRVDTDVEERRRLRRRVERRAEEDM